MDSLKEKVLVNEIEGFDVFFTPLVEFETIEGSFPNDTPKQLEDLVERVEYGDAVWFCAKVHVEKAGIELGSDYLGCCYYDSFEDFYMKYRHDYFADMAKSAINQAKEKIEELVYSKLC